MESVGLIALNVQNAQDAFSEFEREDHFGARLRQTVNEAVTRILPDITDDDPFSQRGSLTDQALPHFYFQSNCRLASAVVRFLVLSLPRGHGAGAEAQRARAPAQSKNRHVIVVKGLLDQL